MRSPATCPGRGSTCAARRSSGPVGVGCPSSRPSPRSAPDPSPTCGDDLTPSTTALLDAAAVIGAGRRAGGRTLDAATAGAAAPPPAPDETDARRRRRRGVAARAAPRPDAARRHAPRRARRPLAGVGRRGGSSGPAPPPRAAARPRHRQPRPRAGAADVLGARGRWLAGLNPDWAWAAVEATIGSIGAGTAGRVGTAHAVDADEWARLPSSARIAVLRAARAADPGAGPRPAGHDVVIGSGDGPGRAPGRARRRPGRRRRGPARGGARRSGRVGPPAGHWRCSTACRRRPGRHGWPSAWPRWCTSRAGGAGARLTVALPDDPDAAAVRDGLVPPPPNRSARGWWVEQLAAGAPLDLWTERSGADPAACLALLAEPGSPGGAGAGADARAGILRAVLARHDAGWAAALLPVRRPTHGCSPRWTRPPGSSS